MFTRTLIRRAALLLVAGAFLGACSEECAYESRCRGDNRLQICREHMEDGNRVAEEETITCAEPNPVCVELDGDHARCVVAAEQTCDADHVETCDGTVARRCRDGHVVGDDCGAQGNACVERPDAATCAREPLTDCDPQTYTETCEGRTALVCETGLVARLECPAACRRTTAERGATVYCE